MVSDELKWIAGAIVAVGGFVMSLIGLDRRTMKAIRDGDDAVERRGHERAREIHAKIDNVREKYVRRDDLDAHLGPIRRDIERMGKQNDQILKILVSRE